MEFILTALIALLLGLLMGFVFGRKNKQAENDRILIREKEEANRMLQEKDARIEELKRDWNEQKAELRNQYDHQLAERDRLHQDALTTQERHQQRALEEMQNKFNETMGRVSAQMKADTQDMLKERQKEFAESSQTNLGQIVTPLRETIDKMKKAMDDSTLKQTAMSSEMKANIELMMRQSEMTRQTAEELTRVFKHGSKVQGDWGETVLNELLESQGLTMHEENPVMGTSPDSGAFWGCAADNTAPFTALSDGGVSVEVQDYPKSYASTPADETADGASVMFGVDVMPTASGCTTTWRLSPSTRAISSTPRCPTACW